MRKPAPDLYQKLKSEDLFGHWRSSAGRLHLNCTGSVEFIERREGEEYNNDTGGHVAELDSEHKNFIVSNVFGKSTYHYERPSEESIEIIVGKRPGWVEGAMKVATLGSTHSSEKRKLLFYRVQKLDCDHAPTTMGEVFKKASKDLKDGNYEVSHP